MGEHSSDLKTAAVDAEAAHGAAVAAVELPDRWRLIELLGAGGQASVWLAEDRTLGQRVALKILPAGADERTRGRWLEEVRQGRRLAHPHLIRIFDVVETGDRPVAVMEFVAGGTLVDRVRADGPQPLNDVIRWASEVLDVLGYLHENRVVHRDVKPSNLLVGEDGSIKLSDLGLVRSLDRSSDLTRTMEGVGTPRFMAPEQLRGEEPSPSCDLYSLGVTLYQLLTGKLPFDGDSAFQIADAHLHLRPKSVREHRPECPRWLARFVERLLEKAPEDRFASAQAASAALEGRQVGISRRAIRWAAVSLVVAVVIVAAGLWLRSSLTPQLDRVEVDGSRVVARSEEGQELWSEERQGQRPRAVISDLVGNHKPEVVVGWSPMGWGEGSEESAVLEIRSESGDVIRSFETAGLGRSEFPDIAPLWQVGALKVGNLLGGGNDLVWALSNPRWYPGYIGVFDLRSTMDTVAASLTNSGHEHKMQIADIDGDGVDEIIAVMVNNPMGFQRVLVTMSARSRLTGETCGTMHSPDISAFQQARLRVPRGCLSYTPLGSNGLVVDPPRVVDGGIEVVMDGKGHLFDSWGNPEGSVLFGTGPDAREAFWEDVAATCARVRLETVLESPFSLDRLRRDHPEIMTEPPTEVAAALVSAKALASGGHRENAIAVLREGARRHPEERDLQLRLGEQLLIDGDRDEGRRWTLASVNLASAGRNHSDQVMNLILDAAITGDRSAREENRHFIANLAMGASPDFVNLLDVSWFFFQGEWDDLRLVDSDVGSVYRWGQVLQEWGRFERDGDVASALTDAAALGEVAEIRDLARVFEARVRLRNGDYAAAFQLAEQAHQSLAIECRETYEACVWMPLAEWVLGQSLMRIEGREHEGQTILISAAEHAPGTWIATSVTR